MISEDTIKRIRTSSSFLEFREYIVGEVEDLNSISGLEKMSNDEAGEEVRVRAKTIDRLVEIFRPFVDFGEKKELTVEEIQRAKQKAGL